MRQELEQYEHTGTVFGAINLKRQFLNLLRTDRTRSQDLLTHSSYADSSLSINKMQRQ